MSLDEFLERFNGVRALHPGQWTAECPAHEDRSHDTLSIALGDEDKRLLYCWAGCETERILRAARLTVHDLFERGRQSRPRTAPTTYQQMVKTELRRILDERARRYGAYRGESLASADIREAHRAASAARLVAQRPDLDEEFRWELLEYAAEWERTALTLEAEQDDRFRAVRPVRGR